MIKDADPGLVYPSNMDQGHLDSAYFNRRASEERAAAERALDPRARQSHIDLAERYSRAAQAGAMEGEKTLEPAAMPLLQPEFRILP
jgi:hypothetical protein